MADEPHRAAVVPAAIARSRVSPSEPPHTIDRMIDRAAFRFAMPNPVRITGRSSSITNSFVNGIIPVVRPTAEQVDEALRILGMDDVVFCAYCGVLATEWDHLRALVIDKQPTGYISEIHNLVPACGKCNQSKGNKPWRDWMFGSARFSPSSRGISDLDERASRLSHYEQWGTATVVNFQSIVGDQLWARYWQDHATILQAMRDAEETVDLIRKLVTSSRAEPSHAKVDASDFVH